MKEVVATNQNVIFKPSKEKLLEARKRREKQWEEINNRQYTREEQLERISVEVEIYENMKLLRERAISCMQRKRKTI